MKNLSNIEHELDIVTKQYVDNAADTKVDKIEGKQLSTNDFSNEDKEKLKNKYPNAELVGHKDIGASDCPGAYFPLDYFKQFWKGDLAMAMLQYADIKKQFEAFQTQLQRLTQAQDVVYHYTQSVPDWGRPTIQKLLDKGFYKGASDSDLNLPETLLRVLVINDRAGLYDYIREGMSLSFI